MAKVGRKSKSERELPPEYTEVADRWLEYIGTVYEQCKNNYINIARKQGFRVDEDIFQQTILNCYDSIARNGLKDQSEQGMRNYIYRSFFTNVNAISNYDRRKDDVEDMSVVNEQYTLQGQATYEKTKQQLFNDYSVIYLLDKVEQNFPMIDFHLYKLKHLINGMTYDRLKEITKVKDCKKRVVKINKWVQLNINYKDVYNAFITDFPSFED